jgi:hypothetical protein
MQLKGHLSVSGVSSFNRYDIFQFNPGFNNQTQIIDFAKAGTQILNLTGILGNTLILSGSGYQPNREVKCLIQTTGAINSIICPSGANQWVFFSNRPTGIGSGLKAVMTLVSTGYTEAGCWVSWATSL